MISHTLYLWHHSHYNSEKTRTMFLTLYSVYMTSQVVKEWQHNDCIWNDTHCICVFKPIWLMTSHPMYVWNNTHCMHDTIGILCDITSTLANKTPFFVCHGTHSLWNHMHYICCHPYCVYDYPSSIPGLKPIKTAISSTLYVITPSQSKTSHLLYKASQVAYVCHHMHYTWHHMHTLWQQPLIFMTSHALYSLHHTHYIWHLLYSMWCHIHYVGYSTQWLNQWHQTHYVYHILTLYGITHSVMTTQQLCAFTATMNDITLSVFLTLNKMYQFYENMCMYVITASICMTPYALYMTSHPLFMTSHHFIYDVKSTESNMASTLSDLTSTVSV